VLLQSEVRVGGAWRTVARLRASPAKVLNVVVSLRGALRLRLRAGPLISGVVPLTATGSRP
jgi:hypothetical protein